MSIEGRSNRYGRWLKPSLCSALFMLAAEASAEQAFPDTAQLRCWYNQPNEATDISTGFKVSKDLPLKGRWSNISATPGANLFLTQVTYAQMKQACDDAVHLPRSITERVPYTERHVLDWYAQSGNSNYNHQIWHVGDQAPGAPVDRIVAFGDSLTDMNNIYNYSAWTLPNGKSWVVGRFSNGPVWVEYFAKRIGVPLNNWSIGASARNTAKGFIDGIGKQVSSFEQYAALDPDYDMSRTLFTFLTGANDLMRDEYGTSPAIIGELLDYHEAALTHLAKIGARKILVLNLPAIANTPSFLRADPTRRQYLIDKTRLYNEGLTHVVERVRQATQADIHLFDMGRRFDEVVASPGAFGMSDASSSCLDLPSGTSIDYLDHVAVKDWCDPQHWVFWDSVHPTTRMHELWAGWVFDMAQATWGVKEDTAR